MAGRAGRGRARPRRAAPGQGWLPGTAEHYRALSEQIPAVLYSEVLTPTGAVIYKSPQNQQLFGYTAEETMQPDFWKTLIHPDDRERVLADNERADRTGGAWHMEYRALTKDGRVLWVRDHAVLIRGEHGEPDYWQGYYIDITQRAGSSLTTEDTVDLVDRLVANAGKLTGCWPTCSTWTG